MRYREPFTLYLRRLPSGKKIWYYQTYDKNNNRTSGFSTGKKSKTAAKAFCFDLLKNEILIPERKQKLTFKRYAENWWEWDKCEYLKYLLKRKTITLSYANTAKQVLRNYLITYFGKMNLDDISSYQIENWLDSFAEKGLSNATAKLSLAILNIMLKEAVRRELIIKNPAQTVRALKIDSVPRGVLTHSEVQKIFDFKKKDEIWIDDISYYANLLSACTGMRIGEILAVRGDSLKVDYIRVDKQYKDNYGLTDTKTHYVREVVIPEELMLKLCEFSEMNSGGFLFSFDGGKKPVSPRKLRVSLVKALRKIGIDDEKRKERNICFHSWRHYMNTTMLSNNIMDGKLRAMVGHSSQDMTDHYTHFNNTDFKDIREIQNKIINFEKVG